MINLRFVSSDDSQQILQWRNLPEVAQYMYSDHVISSDEHNIWFNNMLQSNTKKYWIINLDEEAVGVANITDIDFHNRHCFWAFYLASPSVRGRGVGSYIEYFILHHVFEIMRFNKLCCEVLGFNEAVIVMHQKYGFKQEGVFRQHIFKSDEWHDVVRLAMLQSEWLKSKEILENTLREKGLLNK